MTYAYLHDRNHPMSPPSGMLPLHRALLYDKIGPGEHPCHHCGTPVKWIVGGRTAKGSLIAEHLDGNERNNDPSNLVPSCQACNIKKNSRGIKDGELFIEKDGKRLRAVLRVCETCDVEFLIREAQMKMAKKRPGIGRFCSLPCMYGRSR